MAIENVSATVSLGVVCVIACLLIGAATFTRRTDRTKTLFAAAWGIAFLTTTGACALLLATDLGKAADFAAPCVLAAMIAVSLAVADRIGQRSKHFAREQKHCAEAAAEQARTLAENARTLTAVDGASERFGLTKREREILPMLLDGRTAASIADELVLSVNTVNTHVRHIYRKAGVCDRAALKREVANPVRDCLRSGGGPSPQ